MDHDSGWDTVAPSFGGNHDDARNDAFTHRGLGQVERGRCSPSRSQRGRELGDQHLGRLLGQGAANRQGTHGAGSSARGLRRHRRRQPTRLGDLPTWHQRRAGNSRTALYDASHRADGLHHRKRTVEDCDLRRPNPARQVPLDREETKHHRAHRHHGRPRLEGPACHHTRSADRTGRFGGRCRARCAARCREDGRRCASHLHVWHDGATEGRDALAPGDRAHQQGRREGLPDASRNAHAHGQLSTALSRSRAGDDQLRSAPGQSRDVFL
jgi:hypothetical protein